jgi:DNA-directed RNA polymerase specialized sigma24 family protein
MLAVVKRCVSSEQDAKDVVQAAYLAAFRVVNPSVM